VAIPVAIIPEIIIVRLVEIEKRFASPSPR
jgi:hypothetical protein